MGLVQESAGADVKLGDPMPAWKNLPGADGKEHSADDLRNAKGVLVVFYANHCPDCELYFPRLLDVVKQYQGKGIETVMVSVSLQDEDSLDRMKKFANNHKLPCLYLQDKSQELGKKLGAETTPEAYLFDGKRRLVYHGGIDDHWNAAKVKRRHLAAAIDELLAGKPISVAETEPHGCMIEYEK
jgi:peroxiredoxin